MNVDFTSPENVTEAVRQKISELKEEEKEEIIRRAREEDKFDLQIDRSDEEMLYIAVKYELFQRQE